MYESLNVRIGICGDDRETDLMRLFGGQSEMFINLERRKDGI